MGLVAVLLIGAGFAYLLAKGPHPAPMINPRPAAPPPVAVVPVGTPRQAVNDLQRQLTAQLTSVAAAKLSSLGSDAVAKGGALIPSSVPAMVSVDSPKAVAAADNTAATGAGPVQPTISPDTGAVDNSTVNDGSYGVSDEAATGD
jgi:hypothetical protein